MGRSVCRSSHNELRDITLPYGDQELTVRLPARNVYADLSPNPVAVCPDPMAELERGLHAPIGAPPLRESARGARDVVILADDLTRRTPVRLIVPLLLEELNAGGVRDEQIGVIIALGTHRPTTP